MVTHSPRAGVKSRTDVSYPPRSLIDVARSPWGHHAQAGARESITCSILVSVSASNLVIATRRNRSRAFGDQSVPLSSRAQYRIALSSRHRHPGNVAPQSTSHRTETVWKRAPLVESARSPLRTVHSDINWATGRCEYVRDTRAWILGPFLGTACAGARVLALICAQSRPLT